MELQLGPLIDCVFLLLTYFIFTISLTTIEGLLPAELATGDQAENQSQPPPDQKNIVVRVVQTGSNVQYFIDEWPVTDYEAVVRHLESTEKNSLIVLDAGPNVTYDYVIRLYNQCLRLSFDQIVFPLDAGKSGPLGSAPRS
jgi:biopolymer transport protein ExbD